MTPAVAGLGDRMRAGIARPVAVAEIVRAYVVGALLLGWVGYAAHGWLPAELTSGTARGSVAPTMAEGMWILGNNLGFFILVSLLPVINVLLVAPQFLSFGGNAFLIQELSFADRVALLYRHSIWEVAALLIAVAMSYALLFAMREYLDRATSDTSVLKVRLRLIAWGYPLILTLTVVGALLEGNAVVHF